MVTNLIPTTWRGEQQPVITKDRENEFRIQQSLHTIPSFYSVFDTYSPFPKNSLVIGICSDGFPFMLGLENPNSGSILIVGANSLEKSQIIKTISLSASLINRPEEVSLCVITNKPHQYSELSKFPNCQAIISPYERSAGELVIELASIVEQRRSGRERGEKLLFVVDDFQSLSTVLNDYSVYLNLKTIVANGPKSGVWPLISIEPGDVHHSKGQLLRSFGTYIFEKVENDGSIQPENREIDPGDLIYEPNFNVIVGGRLVPISNLVV